MTKEQQPYAYKITVWSLFAILFLAASTWLCRYFGYHVLGHQEATQLFRTDVFYLHTYLGQPGGLMAYVGSFIIQFYQNHAVGACLAAATGCLPGILLYVLARRNGMPERFFALPLATAMLMVAACSGIEVRVGFVLGVLFALLMYLVYSLFNSSVRRVVAPMLYLLTYFVAGGCALLFILPVFVSEFFDKDNRNLKYILALAIWAAVVPWLAHRLVYITDLRMAYLALTPYTLHAPSTLFEVAWWSVPVVFLLSRLLSGSGVMRWSPVWVIAGSVLLMVGGARWLVHKTNNADVEYIAQMAHEVEEARWDNVLELAKRPDAASHVLKYYYTNLALSEKEQLADRLFTYPQIGQAGMFMSWELQPQITFAMSELYYRLGLMPEAEHSAFESMVSVRYEHGARAIKRLAMTNMLRQDDKGFEKYINLLEHSPTYKSHAAQLREQHRLLKADPDYKVPGAPLKKQTQDFFVNYDNPEYNLIVMLRTNPGDRKLFEYLVCSILQRKDMKMFLGAMDKYYAAVNYKHMPRYIQEAVVFCRHNIEGSAEILDRFTYPFETDMDYREYAAAHQKAPEATRPKLLYAQYRDTFWYYLQFMKDNGIKKSMIESRY